MELFQAFQELQGLNLINPYYFFTGCLGGGIMKSHYMYPAVVKWIEEDKVYDIKFPDIDNAFTFEDNEDDILMSAREVLELCIYDLEEKRTEPNKPTNLKDIKLEENEFVILVEVWMPPVRDRFENKSIKKTLTIPKWLNDIAIENDVNFSNILQTALKEYLGLGTKNNSYK